MYSYCEFWCTIALSGGSVPCTNSMAKYLHGTYRITSNLSRNIPPCLPLQPRSSQTWQDTLYLWRCRTDKRLHYSATRIQDYAYALRYCPESQRRDARSCMCQSDFFRWLTALPLGSSEPRSKSLRGQSMTRPIWHGGRLSCQTSSRTSSPCRDGRQHVLP